MEGKKERSGGKWGMKGRRGRKEMRQGKGRWRTRKGGI